MDDTESPAWGSFAADEAVSHSTRRASALAPRPASGGLAALEDGEAMVELDPMIASAVEIEPAAISEEFARYPADMALWNERYSGALRTHLKAKAALDRTRARRRMELRIELQMKQQGGGPKFSEGRLDDAVEIDPDVMEAVNRVIDAEVERVRLRGVLEALARKGDAIVSLGAQLRAEYNAVPHLRDGRSR